MDGNWCTLCDDHVCNLHVKCCWCSPPSCMRLPSRTQCVVRLLNFKIINIRVYMNCAGHEAHWLEHHLESLS